MAQTFITEDFLLQSKAARRLYHEYAEQMPIYDYHCHLPAGLIAEDHLFENITKVWLAGDHYKWRAMRTNGVDERYITGEAQDSEKFEQWAQTVPFTVRNPLYHWTHLELKRYFGINELLCGENAKDIYDACSEMLRSEGFSVCKLLGKMNVDLVCTTEGPLDNLVHHRKIRENSPVLKVYTAFRPDKSFATEDLAGLNIFIDKLGQICGGEIRTFDSYIEALRQRHEFFHNEGCRLSDYGLETAYAEQYGADEIAKIFEKIRTNRPLDTNESLKFKSAMMFELASMDAETGWVMQLHIGALRNNNSKMLARLGPDTGYDSIGDLEIARPLSIFLDRLNAADKLPKTILYNLNPRDNAVMATMLGNFQEGSIPGKIQYGSAWWFLDQKNGMEDQIEMLSNLGLLSRFVGMTTDSRSFLSFPRHEYFRRILCNIIGGDIEQGLLPGDIEFIGKMVEDICFNNAEKYFAMSLD
jgi:glucuronate isomerase